MFVNNDPSFHLCARQTGKEITMWHLTGGAWVVGNVLYEDL